MSFANQKEATRYGFPPILEKKTASKIPFKVVVKGTTFEGTITPIGEVLSDGMPSAFQVRMTGKRIALLARENGVWSMAADEDLVFELGVWIELYYQ